MSFFPKIYFIKTRFENGHTNNFFSYFLETRKRKQEPKYKPDKASFLLWALLKGLESGTDVVPLQSFSVPVAHTIGFPSRLSQ